MRHDLRRVLFPLASLLVLAAVTNCCGPSSASGEEGPQQDITVDAGETLDDLFSGWVDSRLEPEGADFPMQRDPPLGDARAALLNGLHRVDRIRVFRLDSGLDPHGETTFPVAPYGTYTEIICSEMVPEGVVPTMVALWQKMLQTEETGERAMCHEPEYGISFFSDGRVVFETSMSWRCRNYYIRTRIGAIWVDLPTGEESGRIREMMVRRVGP